MPSNSPGSGSWGMMLLLMMMAVTGPQGSLGDSAVPSCDPLICTCSPDLVVGNCSSKGFLSMPTGLPARIQTLILAQNDLDSINATELSRLSELTHLDLSYNDLHSLVAGVHYKLSFLDLSFNNISSVRSLHIEGLIALSELNLSLIHI